MGRTLRVVPIFRIFSVDNAREFYLEYLGCRLDWEHRHRDNAPLYAQVSRDGLVLHLPEHYGDESPGASSQVEFKGERALQVELDAKNYQYWRPRISEAFWGTEQLNLLDPFRNRIHLCEPKPAKSSPQ
jgi:hypothetical protein